MHVFGTYYLPGTSERRCGRSPQALYQTCRYLPISLASHLSALRPELASLVSKTEIFTQVRNTVIISTLEINDQFSQNSADPGGHLIAMGAFGYAGYLVHKWDVHSGQLLAEKKREIRERRQEMAAKFASREETAE